MKTFVVNSQTVPEIYYIPDVVMVKAYHKKTDELVSICFKEARSKRHVAFVDVLNRFIYLECGPYYSQLYKLIELYPSFVIVNCEELKCKKDLKLVRYRCFEG